MNRDRYAGAATPAPRPMALRRPPALPVESLKARWFALGSLTTAAPLLIAVLLVHFL